LFLFLFQNRNRQTSQSKNSGRCSRNKHSLSTVGSATVDVQRIGGESRRTRADTPHHSRRHTHTQDTRRRSRRRERDSAPRGNGSPFHRHTKKELRLEKGQSTSKLMRSQVTKSRRMTIKLTYGPAYISVHTFFFLSGCVEGVAPPLIWGQAAQVRLSINSSKNKIWPTLSRLTANNIQTPFFCFPSRVDLAWFSVSYVMLSITTFQEFGTVWMLRIKD
jgi:hypothetical protein